METLKHSTVSHSVAQLTFLQEDSHASRSVLQERERARKITVSSGRRCYEQSVKLNRAGLLAKMLLESSAWHSTKCLLRWKVRGTTPRRISFQLVPSTPRTVEIGSGFWPTPKATEINESIEQWQERRAQPKNKMMGCSLTVKAKLEQMLPTPTARDFRSDKMTTENRARRSQDTRGKSLPFLMDGLLNPPFVEQMMGYPLNYTLLEE